MNKISAGEADTWWELFSGTSCTAAEVGWQTGTTWIGGVWNFEMDSRDPAFVAARMRTPCA